MKKLKFFFFSLFVFCSINITNAADKWLAPAAYPVGMDTWFGSTYNKEAVHDSILRIGGWVDKYYSLLRFDLSGFPQSGTEVYLWLYATDIGTTNINWYKIQDQWHSESVTYSNFPFSKLTYLGTTSAPPAKGWYRIGINSIFRSWRKGTSTADRNFGLLLAPARNNNNYSIFSSSGTSSQRPVLQVTYPDELDDGIIKLKWPLATAKSNSTITQEFGEDWAGGVYCGGKIKIHNGTDYSASAGTAVYATEDGRIMHVKFHSDWEYDIVLEHNHPKSGKYTTVYWHVNPTSEVKNILAGKGDKFIPKGHKIATVANLYGNTHFHFGIRIGPYSEPSSMSGALPQTNCDGYPAFPGGFIDVENTNQVQFH